jgi:hypothetical protein
MTSEVCHQSSKQTAMDYGATKEAHRIRILQPASNVIPGNMAADRTCSDRRVVG